MWSISSALSLSRPVIKAQGLYLYVFPYFIRKYNMIIFFNDVLHCKNMTRPYRCFRQYTMSKGLFNSLIHFESRGDVRSRPVSLLLVFLLSKVSTRCYCDFWGGSDTNLLMQCLRWFCMVIQLQVMRNKCWGNLLLYDLTQPGGHAKSVGLLTYMFKEITIESPNSAREISYGDKSRTYLHILCCRLIWQQLQTWLKGNSLT